MQPTMSGAGGVLERMACDLARSRRFGPVEVHGAQANPLDRMWRTGQLAGTIAALSRSDRPVLWTTSSHAV
jgi:hypothetical protein